MRFALVLIHTCRFSAVSHFLKVLRNRLNDFLCLVLPEITGLKPRCEIRFKLHQYPTPEWTHLGR